MKNRIIVLVIVMAMVALLSLTASAEGADHYQSVTAMSQEDVEAFAASVRSAYLDQDWETISGMIRYPITMYPDVEIADAPEFLSYMKGKTVSAGDIAQMEEETCEDMFVNGEGICMGSGQIWLLDENYMESGEPRLQINAVSGIEAD